MASHNVGKWVEGFFVVGCLGFGLFSLLIPKFTAKAPTVKVRWQPKDDTGTWNTKWLVESHGERYELEPPSVPWTFGLQPPKDLFVFRDAVGQPAWCRDTTDLLHRLRDAIANSHTSCAANVTTDDDGTKTLKLSCPLSTEQCSDYYMATIWPERFDGSTIAYVLRNYGWLRRTCVRGGDTQSFDLFDLNPAVRDRLQTVSKDFDDFIAPCKSR